jgi:hypothetical protein
MNMIEKVARAIAQISIADARGEFGVDELAVLVDAQWQDYMPEATAAIAALRDPTADMLIGSWAMAGMTEDRWQAMIDRALNPDIPF